MNKHASYLMLMVWCLLTTVAHAGTKHYYYTDPQGTPLAKADASGTIVAAYDYAPYGQAVASMSGAPDGPGYTGHVNDPGTGLVYMQARYYDPVVGRFLSVDPVSTAPGDLFRFNRYDYASENPVNLIDRNGKDSSWVQRGGRTNIVIPVHFVGSGATNDNVKKIILMSKHLEIINRKYTISIISTNKEINGQLNTMDLSSGYDHDNYGDSGEGVKARGGNAGHINTNNGSWLKAALHDILHFASFKDGYTAHGKGDAREFTGYKPGYDMDDIMADRRGNVILPKEVDDADDWGRRRGSNKMCRTVGPKNITQCD